MSRIARLRRAVWLVPAVATLLSSQTSRAANQTWDPATNGTGSDGSGFWDTVAGLWASPGDGPWVNGNTAIFGTGGTPGTVTIDDASGTVSAAGLTFNAVTGGDYVIAANSGDTLTLAAPTITVNAGSPTISAPIAGTAGLTLAGVGTLNLTGANTYTGTTTVGSGTLVVGPGGTLGAAANGLTIGTTGSTTTGAVTLNNNVTIGALTVSTLTNSNNTLTLGSSNVLTINGASTIGAALATGGANQPGSNLVVTGGGEIDLNNSLSLGVTNSSATSGASTKSSLNLAGINKFVMNAPTGSLNIGTATQTTNTMTLAPTSTVNVATLNVGNTGGTNGRANTLTLGTGTNTIEASTINVGIGKASGTISVGTAGSVTIAGTGGTGTANITLGGADSGSAADTGTLNLAGHNATVQAGTVIVGRTQGGSATGTGTGVITYDVGTATSGGFNAVQLELAQDGNAGGPAVGTFTLGGSAPSTTADNSVLNVTSSFVLANSSGGKTATGNFFINNGTANIGTNIVDTSTAGTHTTNIGLGGAGVLNMNGNSIGTAATPITNVGLSTAGATATLENLGGGGINGAGLTIAPVSLTQGTAISYGVGTLLLAGNNTYTGNTSIASGATLQVGSATLNGNLPSAGNVTNNGTLTFGQGNSFAVNGTISGTGAVNQSGSGTTVLNGPNTYTGATTVSAGTLAGSGSVSDVTMSGGTIAPGDGTLGSIGTLTLNSLNMSAGTLSFDVGPTGTSDKISVTNAANFTGGGLGFALSGDVSNGDVFTLLTSSALTNTGLALTPVTIGRTTITPSISSNSIIATITGGPASLFWNNAGGTGGGNNWNTTSQNWQNGVNDGAHPDVFFQGDNVTFNDTNNGHYTVAIPNGVTVSPASMTVNNSSANYDIGGGASAGSIGGATGITKQGTAGLTLSSANSFTGPVNIDNGTITVGIAGAIPSGDSVTLGDGGANSGTLDLGGVGATVGGLAVSGSGTSNAVTNNGASPATLTFTTGTSTFGGVIQDGINTTGLTVTSGSLTLSGADTYTGGTNVTGGALTVSGSIADPSVSVGAAGTLTVAPGGNIATATNLTDNGSVNFNNPTRTIASLNGGGTVSLNGTALTISNGGTFSGTLKDGTSAGSLTASGGSLVLSGNSTYTGSTTISSGATVKVVNSTSLGATSGTTVGNVFISGGTLDVGGSPTANALNFGAKVFHIQGTGVSNAGAITNSSAITQFTAFNFITLDNDASITGSRIDIGRTFPTSTTLDLQGHKLTLSMSGAQPIFGILDKSNVTGGQIEVAAGGIDIERTAMVLSDVNGSAITFDNGTVAQFFQNTANDVTRPMTFQGNNVIGSGSGTVGTVNSTMTLNGNVTLEGLASGVPTATANNPINIAGNVIQGTGSSSVTKVGPFNATLSGANTYTGGTIVSAGTLTIAGNGSLPAGGAVTNNATLQVNANVSPGQVTGTGTLTIGTAAGPNSNVLALASGSGQSTQSALTVNSGSTLDITNNSFDIHYGAGTSPDATVRSYLLSGYNGGTWNGTGVTSSTAAADIVHQAVGYADGADNIVAGLAAGDELIKYTFAGDANLDGKVDVSDLGILATNYGHLTGQRWDQADFTYDGGVDVSDLGVLATNYGAGTGVTGAAAAAMFQSDLKLVEAEDPAFAAAIGAVPEPASLGLLAIGSLAMLGRRRRKNG